jgi:hypothetical protein
MRRSILLLVPHPARAKNRETQRLLTVRDQQAVRVVAVAPRVDIEASAGVLQFLRQNR